MHMHMKRENPACMKFDQWRDDVSVPFHMQEFSACARDRASQFVPHLHIMHRHMTDNMHMDMYNNIIIKLIVVILCVYSTVVYNWLIEIGDPTLNVAERRRSLLILHLFDIL